MLAEIRAALGPTPGPPGQDDFRITGNGSARSAFAATDLAVASIAAAGLAMSGWLRETGQGARRVSVDRRLASFWFGTSIRPQGWNPPPVWDPLAADYRCCDGWVRLHTNAPAHRAAALRALGTPPDKDAVAARLASMCAQEVEDKVVAAGGCAAAMRSIDEWAGHPQGRALAAEPLVHARVVQGGDGKAGVADAARPLAGIRVLDLTRVLAGPVATRFLAGFGAEVLRIDPPDWDEPMVVMEVMPGKKTARLDLRDAAKVRHVLDLLAGADVFVHGLRPGALEALGLGEAERQRINPGLVDVSLDAYGWSGPWAGRRGFDSLVQMSCGIAEAGMRRFSADRPTPLPFQALDQATGYLMAAAAVTGLMRRRAGGSRMRLSLARTARLLMDHAVHGEAEALREEESGDLAAPVEMTSWGPARRLAAPFRIEGAEWAWTRPARKLGSDAAAWD
jgi:crotonobetainyl-CoA:carnitine CoA-transferase CaiB-like acyl-CoA transferase